MKKAFLMALFFGGFSFTYAQSLTTVFEKSNGKESATYFEAIRYYQQLNKKFSNILIKTFDTTDSGFPLHLVLFSTDGLFDPAKWHRQGKVVILINNGIHAGEPDGIDASMMLARNLATGKVKAPGNVVLAIIPVYNIGGTLNRSSFSRVNQQGPASYGFRGNAQNLDLNRDFAKCDSKNAKGFAKIFHYLNPDIFIDNHVSDGADYQHTMTLLTSQHNKLGGPVAAFLKNEFEPALYKGMEQKQWLLVPYVNFEEGSAEKGWTAYYDPPRYSSGFASLFQTIAFVPETHMLKPFNERVKSTYDLMLTMIEESSKQAASLIQSRQLSVAAVATQTKFALSWKADTTQHELIRFQGYETGMKTSEVTGMPRMFYDHNKPYEKQVKFYNIFKATKMVTAPKAYIVPQGWWAVTDLLRINNVAMRRLASDTTIEVEVYRIEDYKSAAKPYEKHHKNSDVVTSKSNQAIRFLKGDYIIYCNQSANRYIVEMLEPEGDDSFFSWNFFDAILQQKEGYSEYRWEEVAAAYISQHPEVKQLLEDAKKTDQKLAASASAQLNFVYKHSPYYEPAHLRYPVYRLIK